MSPADNRAGKSRFPLHFSLGFTFLFILLYWPQALLLPFNGFFAHLEDAWQDKMFVLRESSLRRGDGRLILAAMDDATGKKYGFPLPRSVQARLLDKLRLYGVKTAVFDVMFFEPRENDAEFIAATKRFKKAIHLFQTETKHTDRGEVVSMNNPIPGLEAAAEHTAYPNVDQFIDDDGHVRRTMLFDARINNPKNPDQIAPSVDAAAAASFTDRPLSFYISRYAQPRPVVLLVNFRPPHEWLAHQKRDAKLQGKVANLETFDSSYQRISFMDLLSGELTPEQIKNLRGALVIVGSTSLGYFDHYPTPFLPVVPGAEYHANVIDNILHEDFFRAMPRGATILVLLFMIWLPLFLLDLPPLAAAAVTASVFAAWFLFGWWQFARLVRVEFTAPLTALLAAFLVQTVHRVLTEGQEKKFIKNLFGQFVAPEVVEDLAKDPAKIKLGGEKRDMTIFFLDIAHFTNISEKMPPEALILFLNKYLSALSHVVHEQKGVVDKYIGDCIMAFWNAPLTLPDHRARACLAAIQCQNAMAELNKDLDRSMPEIPAIRIGLNSGEVTVGLTGSQKKLQYTVIGDEVNLASRLEGANKFFGSSVLASEATYEGAKDAVEARELGRVRVVGKEKPIKVFELLAEKGRLGENWKKVLPFYEKGVAHFNGGRYSEAVLAFSEVVKILPSDGPGNLYLNLSKDYSALPPQKGWDGVFNLTAK